jgi:cystathionine beta-lyase/cystathionine gamma-synthase
VGRGPDNESPTAAGAATRAVHAGRGQAPPHAPAVTPIYQTAPFVFETAEQLAAGFDRPDQAGLYTRYANPTVRGVEEKLAALEGAEDAVAFASGMAAISGLLSTLLHSGDRLLAAADLYGGTACWIDWLTEHHPGVAVERLAMDDLPAAVEAAASAPKVVYVESPTNPLLRCCDLERVGAACADRGTSLVVDNTFATPILQRPLELGATFVVHSATKYLGGHGDLTAGVVAGAAAGLVPLRRALRLGGACLDPHTGFLLARGMQTLALRVERQCANAARLAAFLRRHPSVERVYYPDDDLARRQMSAGGAMVSFDVAGGLAGANRALDRLRWIRIRASLGSVETTAVLPAVTSHKHQSAEQRAAQGIADGLIRMSVGIEDPADLEADLAQALGA